MGIKLIYERVLAVWLATWGYVNELLTSKIFIYSFTKTTPQLKEIKNNYNYQA